jgi:hypothetical protein
MSATVTKLRTGDKDAIAIGNLCEKAKGSLVDAVKYLIEAGEKLTRKKAELNHGEWMPWLKENVDVLGFGHPTATRMMKAAGKYCAGATFTETEASQISKNIWGHTKAGRKPRRRQVDGIEEVIVAKANAGLVSPQIAAELGIDGRAVRHVIEHAALVEQTRIEVLEGLNIDPKKLSVSAQAKLEVAKRVMEHRLNAKYAERMRKVDEEVRLRVVAEGKEYIERMKELEAKAWAEEKHWREMNNKNKPLFTIDEFKAILMCLHPDGDRTPEKLAIAFRLFNSRRKPWLTGERS